MKIKGFTLIEVMIVALLAGIVGTGVVFVIANSNTVLTDSAVRSFKNGNAQRIFNQLASDVHEGARMVSAGATEEIPVYTLLITDTNDNPMFEWSSIKGALSRKVYDLSTGSYSIQKITVISSGNRIITPVVGYYVELKGELYKVDISLALEEKSQDGVKIGDTNYRNTYFCRLDPLLFP